MGDNRCMGAGKRASAVLPWALSALAACGGTAAPPLDPGLSAHEVAARRVLTILESRHVDGHRLDPPRARRATELLLARLDPGGRCTARTSELLHAYGGRARVALRSGDASLAQSMSRECSGASIDGDAARTQMFQALAGSFDPHSTYLPPERAEDRRKGREVGPGGNVRGRIVEHVGRRIAHVVLPTFYLRAGGRSAGRDLAHVVGALATRGAEVLVLDLRGNGGGVMAEASEVLAVLAGDAALGHSAGADGAVTPFPRGRRRRAWAGPLVVWVDEGTASAAELVAAALQDQGHALVVGGRTQGKGTVQSQIWLASPLGARVAAVQVTTARMYRVDGRGLQQEGVRPDVVLRLAELPTERERPGALPWKRIELREADAIDRPVDEATLEGLRKAARGLEGDAAVWTLALRWADTTR